MTTYSEHLANIRELADKIEDSLDNANLENGNTHAATAFRMVEQRTRTMVIELERILKNCETWIPAKKRRRKKPGPSETKKE